MARGWPRLEYTITPGVLRALVDAHRALYGRFPSARSGATTLGPTWMALDQAIRHGSNGWPRACYGGLSAFIADNYPAAEVADSLRRVRSAATRANSALREGAARYREGRRSRG